MNTIKKLLTPIFFSLLLILSGCGYVFEQTGMGGSGGSNPPVTSGVVTLLLHFDGNYTDSSASNHTMDVRGSVPISSSTYKFGSGSADFNGTNQHIRINSPGNDFIFGASPYTIDFWIKTTDTSGYLLNTDGGVSNGNTAVMISIALGKVVLNEKVSNVSNTITSTTTITDGSWHHIAVVRESSGGSKLYIDGNHEVQQPSVYNISAGGEFNIGSDNDSADPVRYIAAFFDEVRVIKGGAYWTNNFTPPTSTY